MSECVPQRYDPSQQLVEIVFLGALKEVLLVNNVRHKSPLDGERAEIGIQDERLKRGLSVVGPTEEIIADHVDKFVLNGKCSLDNFRFVAPGLSAKFHRRGHIRAGGADLHLSTH